MVYRGSGMLAGMSGRIWSDLHGVERERGKRRRGCSHQLQWSQLAPEPVFLQPNYFIPITFQLNQHCLMVRKREPTEC